MSRDNKPIGYWLKHLDRLIEDGLARLLAEDGLTRRHWQVLNTVAAGADPRAELTPFWERDGHAADIIADLVSRGWISAADPPALTSAGRSTHADLLERVTAARRRVADGFTADEYQAVVDGLRRMAANLERAAA